MSYFVGMQTDVSELDLHFVDAAINLELIECDDKVQ